MTTTAPSWDGIFVRDERLVTRTIAEETFIVPVEGELANLQKLFVLDEVGRFIWDRLDGKQSLGEVRSAIAEAFDIDAETAAQDCLEFVNELQAAQLIKAV